MQVQSNIDLTVKLTAYEYNLISKVLAGVKLSKEDRLAAAALNIEMLEHRARLHKEALMLVEGAIKKALDEPPGGTTITDSPDNTACVTERRALRPLFGEQS